MKKKKQTITRSADILNRKIRKKTSHKLVLLFTIVILAFFGITLYITYINTKHGAQYARQVLSQNQASYDSRTIPYQRGDITDRNGTILATSEKVYNVILDCKVVNTRLKNEDGEYETPYVEPTVKALIEKFGLDETEIRERLQSEKTRESQYQIIKRQISITEKKAFESYVSEYAAYSYDSQNLTKEEKRTKAERENIKGIWFEEDYLRYYPMNNLACDLIGFTSAGNTANWGIEGYYSSVLNGVNGRQYGYYKDGSGMEQTIIEPVAGHNVISTIDVNIQQIIRSSIETFNYLVGGDGSKKGANNIAIIAMNPNNGEILGMDSTDWYDLNDPYNLDAFLTPEEQAELDEEERLKKLNEIWRNFCVSDTFEPGSTAKPMNIAGAISSGMIDLNDEYHCEGVYEINGIPVQCSIYPRQHGIESICDALRNSCNPALMQIAEEEGPDVFLKYQNIFGFGSKTGIDLPGEAAGIVYNSDNMGDMELATSSFGQGYNVTMVQQIAAFCSVINGGYYYQPHVVKEITDTNGAVIQSIEPTLVSQTISSDVSAILRSYLQRVVEDGTGVTAKVPGYTMGGKTGTAQTFPRGNNEYIVSFIGYAPANNPQVCVYVVIDRPHVAKQDNSELAQNVAKLVFEELLPYMNIFMDDDDFEETPIEANVADGTNEVGTQNENIATPLPTPEDQYVTNGGNNLTTDGITNAEADLVAQ